MCLLCLSCMEMIVRLLPTKRGDKQTTKPKMICDYNENMGGVDLCDQLFSYNNIGKKSCKWTQRLIFRLIDMCIVNSLVAFTANNPAFKDVYRKHKVFREPLAHQLVQKLLNRKADPDVASPPGPGRPAQSNEKRLSRKHFTSRHDVRRRCVACSTKRTAEGKYVDKNTNDYVKSVRSIYVKCVLKSTTLGTMYKYISILPVVIASVYTNNLFCFI